MRMDELSTYLRISHTHYTFSFSASLHPFQPEFMRGFTDEEFNCATMPYKQKGMSLLIRHWRTILFEVEWTSSELT